jgi:hypothetical protein
MKLKTTKEDVQKAYHRGFKNALKMKNKWIAKKFYRVGYQNGMKTTIWQLKNGYQINGWGLDKK